MKIKVGDKLPSSDLFYLTKIMRLKKLIFLVYVKIIRL